MLEEFKKVFINFFLFKCKKWNIMEKCKTNFYIFLLIHFIVWSCIGLIRVVLPTDSLEGIYWGSLLDFGTPKHPPLAGWISYFVYNFFKTNYCMYFLSQIFIITGFIYIYKLAKYFLDSKAAMLSVIILEGCWIYTYITGYYGFNPDVVLLLTLPAISYYFYKSVTYNKLLDWCLFGLFSGISFMNKYQTGFIIIAIIIWTLFYKRSLFKNKYLYLSIIIAFLIFLPHMIWLYKYDFFPMLYYQSKLATIHWYSHLSSPLKFLFMQIIVLIGTLTAYFIYIYKNKKALKFPSLKDEKFGYLLLLTFVPLAIHLFMGVCSGSDMRPQWNYVFWYLTGILLFYLVPNQISKQDFKFFLICSYTFMFIIFISFSTILSVEKNFRSRYPVNNVIRDFNEIWLKEYSTPLKYIGGFHELTYPITIYDKNHLTNIMDTYGYKNIWIDENDLKISGALIFSRHADDVITYTKSACPYLPNDFEIQPVEYKLIVQNTLKQQREYKMYYFLVPPQN